MSEQELISGSLAPLFLADNSSDLPVPYPTAPDDDRYLSDVWVGVVLTLMVLSSLACLCSCFIFQAYRQWQHRVHDEANAEACYDSASLPSYTVVGGLPTYEEAMERAAATSQPQPEPALSSLSVGGLLHIYKEDVKK